MQGAGRVMQEEGREGGKCESCRKQAGEGGGVE